jgi:hypothetical protein
MSRCAVYEWGIYAHPDCKVKEDLWFALACWYVIRCLFRFLSAFAQASTALSPAEPKLALVR